MDDSAFEINYTSLPTTPAPSKPPIPPTADESTRDAHLRAELASLKRTNAVIQGLLSSLDRAKANMHTVNQTVSQSSALLDTWTRILNVAEHNQRLILNPAWQGATNDLQEADADAAHAARERERRAADEARKRAAAEEARARKAEEDEERRAQAESAPRGAARGGRAGSGSVRSRAGSVRGQRAAAAAAAAAPRFAPTEEEERKAAAQRARARGRAAIMHYGRVKGGASSRGRGGA